MEKIKYVLGSSINKYRYLRYKIVHIIAIERVMSGSNCLVV